MYLFQFNIWHEVNFFQKPAFWKDTKTAKYVVFTEFNKPKLDFLGAVFLETQYIQIFPNKISRVDFLKIQKL